MVTISLVGRNGIDKIQVPLETKSLDLGHDYEGERLGGVVKVKGIDKLRSLEEISLAHFQKLEDISFLSKLPELRVINIVGNDNIDFGFTKGLLNLKALIIQEGGGINKANIAFRTSIEYLEFSNCQLTAMPMISGINKGMCVLNLFANRIDILSPDNIEEIKKYKMVILIANGIKTLPSELKNVVVEGSLSDSIPVDYRKYIE